MTFKYCVLVLGSVPTIGLISVKYITVYISLGWDFSHLFLLKLSDSRFSWYLLPVL